MKTRIVRRTSPIGDYSYVIQRRHFLFRWLWIDARLHGGYCVKYPTLGDATRFLPLYEGGESVDTVVYPNHS